MKRATANVARETSFAESLFGDLPKPALRILAALTHQHRVSVENGDVRYFDGGWYVTHSGLLKLALRRHCVGIHVRPALEACDPSSSRWVFKATVFKSHV